MQKIFTVAFVTLLSACVNKNTEQSDQSYALPEQNMPTLFPKNKGKWVEEKEITPQAPQERVIPSSLDIYKYSTQTPEVVRYDRYLLVGSSPQEGQKYLLEQLVNVNVSTGSGKKKSYNATVRQGLNTALAHTGFTLCHVAQSEVTTLFSLQLPKIHYEFGPVKLREALQMLAGPAYDLTVNDINRTVCFKPRTVPENAITPVTEVITTTTEVIETETP